MPFFIYEKEDFGDYLNFRLIKQIQCIPRLFIEPVFSSIPDDYNEKYFKWKRSEIDISNRISEICEKLVINNPVLVVDLKPNKDKIVSLFQIKNLYGCTDKNWTPICVKLGVIFDEKNVENPKQKKQLVNVKKNYFNKDIIEFLYIQKGFQSGKGNWGPIGSVNAALLWPEVFKYFVYDCLNLKDCHD
ncbi:MAG: hypothetical protein V1715_09840 [bacterium]